MSRFAHASSEVSALVGIVVLLAGPTPVKAETPVSHWKRVSDLRNMKLENRHGEELGRIRDFAISVPQGDVTYAIVTTGGWAGIGKTTRVVPFPAISFATAKRNTASVDIKIERWQHAPKVKRKNVPSLTPNERDSIARFFRSEQNADESAPPATGRDTPRHHELRLASELIGKAASNGNESLGKVVDLKIDARKLEPVKAVLRRGMFRGEEFTLPLNSLEISEQKRGGLHRHWIALGTTPYFDASAL